MRERCHGQELALAHQRVTQARQHQTAASLLLAEAADEEGTLLAGSHAGASEGPAGQSSRQYCISFFCVSALKVVHSVKGQLAVQQSLSIFSGELW